MPGQAKARVLVVDDNRVNRRLIEANLFREGFDVHCAESGAQCLEMLEADEGTPDEGFDMVLLDIMMPEIDGIEVLRRIRKTNSRMELPIIMVTSKDESEDVIEALEAGANDYVMKPIDFPVLLRRMDTHIALRKSSRDLRDSHRSLIHAAKLESVGYLAAGVAHEIRNPLAQIQMGLEGLKHLVGGENESVGKMVDTMVGAVEQADGIVSGLMRYSTEQRLQLESQDLNAVVKEALTLLEESTTEAKTNVKLELDESGPVALMEPEEIKRVLLNVIVNAIHAMPEGGELTIRTGEQTVEGVEHSEGSRSSVKLRNGDTASVIVVEDDGPGMAEEDLMRIYDPFFTSKATGKGSGLGMTVARRIMDLHGGMVQAQNRDDTKGLKVTLLLRKKAGLMI